MNQVGICGASVGESGYTPDPSGVRHVQQVYVELCGSNLAGTQCCATPPRPTAMLGLRLQHRYFCRTHCVTGGWHLLGCNILLSV